MPLDPTTLTIAAVAAVLLLKLLLSRRTPAAVVAEKIKAGATVVDVRSEGEFRGGAYRGALNVPLQQLSSKLHRIPKTVRWSSTAPPGNRSAVAVRLLKKAGYADVSNAGGLHHLL